MTRNAANEAQHGKAESASSVHALSITTDESLCPHLRALVSKVIVGINSARGLSHVQNLSPQDFPVNLWKLAALHLLFGYNLPLYIKNC